MTRYCIVHSEEPCGSDCGLDCDAAWHRRAVTARIDGRPYCAECARDTYMSDAGDRAYASAQDRAMGYDQ